MLLLAPYGRSATITKHFDCVCLNAANRARAYSVWEGLFTEYQSYLWRLRNIRYKENFHDFNHLLLTVNWKWHSFDFIPWSTCLFIGKYNNNDTVNDSDDDGEDDDDDDDDDDDYGDDDNDYDDDDDNADDDDDDDDDDYDIDDDDDEDDDNDDDDDDYDYDMTMAMAMTMMSSSCKVQNRELMMFYGVSVEKLIWLEMENHTGTELFMPLISVGQGISCHYYIAL